MNRIKHNNTGHEKGQAMILFSFMVVVLLICIMLVVDVGFFLHARQKAQQTADAAALAGAQELPDDPDQAEVIALDYVDRNGLDPADVDVTFSCTSDTDNVCQDGDGRYDTIRVTPHVQAPSFFGAVLTFIGTDNCWVDGCTAQASAGACRGACGPIGTGPADIVTILDHSYSMSTTDLANAKSAATSMYTDFNSQYQRIGLSLTPPVSTSDYCDAINSWNDTKVWLPGPLTNTFQTSPHVLNNSSPPVQYTTCADRTSWSSPGELTDYPMCSCHTDVGSALKAAADELSANGRDDVTWGIILLTDGASNVAPTVTTTSTSTSSGDTGWNSCASNQAVTSSAGDNNGFQSNASAACSNGGSYAEDTDSGNGTSTSCSSTNKDKHRYYDFNLGNDIPNNATIDGIELRLDAWTTGTPSTRNMCVELSGDDGSTWTAAKTQSLSGSETSYYLGNSTDTWGRTWDDNEFDGNNFRIRITDVSNTTWTDFRLDYLAAKVYYTSSTSTTTTTFDNNLGPCDYTMTQAAYAKSLGIEVYVIGYGLDANEQCEDFAELSTSAYDQYTAEQLLTAVATDASHFYNAPQNGDLTGIFASIGSELTGGSRLVE
jgi:hypothetical protein